MARRSLLPLLVVGVLLTAAGLASARTLVLEGTEAPACPLGKLDCFLVVEGELDGLVPGEVVDVTLRSAGNAPHNVFVTTSDQATEDPRDTPASAAFASSETAGPGEEVNFAFTVPTDAEGLYLWCDVGNHETLGMYLTASIAGAAPETGGDETDDAGNGTGAGNETGPTDPQGEDIPLPPLITLFALLAAVAVLRRR